MLLKLKGIGPEFAAILWSEGLFRHYDNRRQLRPRLILHDRPAEALLDEAGSL
jgi:transposase